MCSKTNECAVSSPCARPCARPGSSQPFSPKNSHTWLKSRYTISTPRLTPGRRPGSPGGDERALVVGAPPSTTPLARPPPPLAPGPGRPPRLVGLAPAPPSTAHPPTAARQLPSQLPVSKGFTKPRPVGPRRYGCLPGPPTASAVVRLLPNCCAWTHARTPTASATAPSKMRKRPIPVAAPVREPEGGGEGGGGPRPSIAPITPTRRAAATNPDRQAAPAKQASMPTNGPRLPPPMTQPVQGQ
jgi:hypothetical protein